MITVVSLSALALAILTAIVPGWKAARTRVAVALRAE
jgi:ABC-type lipoprotein release transport system permease subunit